MWYQRSASHLSRSLKSWSATALMASPGRWARMLQSMRWSDFSWPLTGSTADRRRSSRLIWPVMRHLKVRQNARAVCSLRLGQQSQAIDYLKPEILRNGSTAPHNVIRNAWIVTYATALALSGDPQGAVRALGWVKEACQPAPPSLAALSTPGVSHSA